MNLEPLVMSLLGTVMLLENSDDTDINPDVAVAGMEAIANALGHMGPEDLRDFIDVVHRIADGEQDPDRREFYRSVPFMLGLVP